MDQLNYILVINELIMEMLREDEKHNIIFHLIYDMWDIMIENVEKVVYAYEGNDFLTRNSNFFLNYTRYIGD